MSIYGNTVTGPGLYVSISEEDPNKSSHLSQRQKVHRYHLHEKEKKSSGDQSPLWNADSVNYPKRYATGLESKSKDTTQELSRLIWPLDHNPALFTCMSVTDTASYNAEHVMSDNKWWF